MPIITATGSGTSGFILNQGGTFGVAVFGTFGGTSITLQQSFDGGFTWQAVQSDTTTAGSPATPAFTGNACLPVFIPSAGSTRVRSVTAGGSGINVNWQLLPGSYGAAAFAATV